MESIKLVDFHTHIYPWPELPAPLQAGKTLIKWIYSPVSTMHHIAQSKVRRLPPALRALADEIGTPFTLPHLLTESSVQDLEQEMRANGVEKAVVMPHPPLISNEFVHSACKTRPNLIPAVFLDPETIKSAQDLEAFWHEGFRIYKVNPLQTGVPASDPYYFELLKFLDEKGGRVVLHTGNIESHLFFKSPKAGDIENYRPWFEAYKNTRFLCAHMNYHEPEKAIELAKITDNLQLICSWQPVSVIQRALHMLGEDKIVFGSDWPLLGGNIGYKRAQFLKLFSQRKITLAALEKIFWKNAYELLSLS